MKTYEALFEPGKNKGVYSISLVEDPAMKGHFIALSETPITFKTVNEDERLLIGLVLEPDKPVYRNQDGEEFYIVFAAATIKELSHSFYKGGFHSNSSLEHSEPIDGVTFVESWIIEDSKIDKSAALGLSYPKGSWIATMKVDSDEVWNDYVKSGKVKGFSIDALVSLKEVKFKSEIKMTDHKSITDAIEKGFENFIAKFKKNTIVELGSTKTINGEVDIQFEGDTMEVGGRVWVNAEDGTEVALPVGQYELEDKKVLVVTEEGVIAEIKDVPADPEKPADAQPAEMTAAQSAEVAKSVENAIKSVMIKYAEASDKKIKDLEAKVLELSEQPAAKPIKAVPAQAAPKNAAGRLLSVIQNS